MGKDYILARKLIQSMENSTGDISAENVVVSGGLDLQSVLDGLAAQVAAVNSVAVVYDANGGTGTMTDPDSPYSVGKTIILMASTFVPQDGKIFSHWTLDGDEAHPGDGFTVTPAVRGMTMTLYAYWVDA